MSFKEYWAKAVKDLSFMNYSSYEINILQAFALDTWIAAQDARDEEIKELNKDNKGVRYG